MVADDRSLSAMIRNDEEKSWMLPLLEFRNYIACCRQDSDLTPNEMDRRRRDFRRLSGCLTWHRGRLVHGPYTKEAREDFLRRLLRLQLFMERNAPPEVRGTELITMEELRAIRRIWLEEKHEFCDSLPIIYKEVTGKEFEDSTVVKNRYYGREEWDLISEICSERYPGYTLLPALVGSLLDTESRNSVLGVRRNAVKSLEAEIRHSFYRDEKDAEEMLRARRLRQGLPDDTPGAFSSGEAC